VRAQLLYAVYVPTFILAFCQGMLALLLPVYVLDLGLSFSLIGLVLAGYGIGTLIGDLPAGGIQDRIGNRRSMTIGICVMGLGMLALSQSERVVMLVLCGISIGAGAALWNVSRHAYLANNTLNASRGRAISIFGGVNRIGMFAGPITGGYLSAEAGMQTAFAFCGVIALLALIFPFLFVREGQGELPPEQRTSMARSYRHLLSYLRSNGWLVTPAGFGMICAQTIRAGRQTIIPLYAATVLGLDVDKIGLVMGIAAAVDMSMFYPAGYVMDRFGRKFAYVPSFLLQALGMALIPLTGSFAALLAVTSLIGFGNGLGSGTMLTLGADLAPPKGEGMGAFLGLWRLIGDTGHTSAPIIVGTIADALSLVPSIYVIAIIGLGSGSILGLFVPETLKKPSAVGAEPAAST
jgi:MFS family permease